MPEVDQNSSLEEREEIIREALSRIASGRVLISIDFDGTISEIVVDPDRAVPVEGAAEALTALAGRKDLDVAVVSGRTLADLRRMLGPPPGVVLVGEHGAARDGVAVVEHDLFHDVRTGLERIAAPCDGARVEVKGGSLTFHTREVADAMEPAILHAITTYLDRWAGELDWQRGKRVVDVTFSPANKGTAIEALRSELNDRFVIYFGDDTTDETVFASLRPDDLGIKVGHGETAATLRVATPADVATILTVLATS